MTAPSSFFQDIYLNLHSLESMAALINYSSKQLNLASQHQTKIVVH